MADTPTSDAASSAATDSVLVSRSGPVGTVTLNRPERLNALDLPMWRALKQAMDGLLAEEGLRCVVLRGAGKAFAAGADISEFDTVRATPAQAMAYDEIMRATFTTIRDYPLPVVAAIRGACVGGGLELACLCDLRFASPGSRFGVPITRISVVMAYPELEAITRLIGPAHTASIMLEGRIIQSEEAAAMGLINRILPEEEAAFEEALAEITASLSKGAPLVNAWHKKFIRRLGDPTPITPEELAECYEFLKTEDYREGQAAFKEKRKPSFNGR